jgi:hypothetical protein
VTAKSREKSGYTKPAIGGGAGGLTNANSKSLRHDTTMKSMLVAWYNLVRKHETMKDSTPAMGSGLSDHVWTIKELIESAAA